MSALISARAASLIGVPTDVGAGDRGSSMGPEALRVAGLHGALTRLGLNVLDCGNVGGPRTPVCRRRAAIVIWHKSLLGTKRCTARYTAS